MAKEEDLYTEADLRERTGEAGDGHSGRSFLHGPYRAKAMKERRINFKIGDSVKVKKGVMCPDYENLCIEGWQGRVAEITEERDSPILVCIRWDSVTLKKMPSDFIDQSEEEGLDYTCMYLELQDLEMAKARDTEKDVADILEKISKSHAWSWIGEEGKRIQKVLAGVDEEDEMEALEAWEKYLRKHLAFPFDAEVAEYQERGPLQAGDRVSVKRISMVDDLYGIIVELRRGREKYAFPLCDLEVINKNSPNYQPVKDYCVWFANR